MAPGACGIGWGCRLGGDPEFLRELGKIYLERARIEAERDVALYQAELQLAKEMVEARRDSADTLAEMDRLLAYALLSGKPEAERLFERWYEDRVREVAGQEGSKDGGASQS